MKRNLLILVNIMLIGFVVNSCGDDEKEPPVCNLGAHLGIDETCNGNNCTLQDHRNEAQRIAFPDNGVGRPIYRYGKLSNYNISDPKEIEKTVDKIIEIFTRTIEISPGIAGLLSRGEKIYDRINANIDKLCVTKSEDGTWTWGGDGTVLGVDPAADASNLMNRFARIDPSNSMDLDVKSPVANLTQLQPVSNIRLTKGKKQTEHFTFISDSICNLSYTTVVYKKLYF